MQQLRLNSAGIDKGSADIASLGRHFHAEGIQYSPYKIFGAARGR